MAKTTSEDLAAVSRAFRKGLGLSQAAVALRAAQHGHRISQAALSDLETGRMEWSGQHIDAVAAGLGVDARVLRAMRPAE